MDFLIETLINIEYFLCFLCIGEHYLHFSQRHIKYKKILLMLIAIAVSVNGRIVNVFGQVVVHIFSVILVIVLFFEENWVKRFTLYFSMTVVLAMLTPIFEVLIESILYVCNVGIEDDIIKFLGYTLLLFYIWFIGIFFKKKFLIKIQNIENGYLIFLIVILCIDSIVVSLLGEFVQLNEHESAKLKLILVYIFVVMGILIQLVLLVNAVITRNISQENEKLAKQFLDSQKEHYEYLEKRDVETKRFRHDIRNHLIVMSELLQRKEYKEVENYLHSIDENVNRFGNYVNVNNGIANAIINKFYNDAKEKGIDIHVKGHFPVECSIPAYDICIVLSNLLSNAVVAVAKCKKKREVLIDIRYTEKEIMILVENHYEHELKIRDGVFESTKTDGYIHGFGLQNVKTCVERNGGYMHISTEDNCFRVMLSIRCEKEAKDETSDCRG